MLDQNDLASFGARFGHPFPGAASRLARPQDLGMRLHVPRQIRKRTSLAVVDVRKAHRNRVVRAERAHADVVADDGIVILGHRFGRTPQFFNLSHRRLGRRNALYGGIHDKRRSVGVR